MNNAALQWIVGHDTGTSSITIWSVMNGVEEYYRQGIPLDVDDFGRCVRLLVRVPEYRDRLQEVANKYPEWQPIIDDWKELERLYWKWEASDYAVEVWHEFNGRFSPVFDYHITAEDFEKKEK